MALLALAGGGRTIRPSSAMRRSATLADIVLGRLIWSTQPKRVQSSLAMEARVGRAGSLHSSATRAMSAPLKSRPQ